jgi:zinc resistance-associated protein
MKKRALMIVAAIVIAGLVAGTAFAGKMGGPRAAGDRGYCGAGTYGPMSQAFAEDTYDLRKQMAVKRGEYQALMAGQNPDPARAGKLKQEMFESREQIRTKAREHNVPMNYGAGAGYGPEDRGLGNPACPRR